MMKFGPKHGTFALRIALGLLFIVPGLGKLFNPAMPAGMLTDLGFPAPVLFAWILILAEVLGGAALLIGWQTKLAVFPLGIVMLVALLLVALPGMLSSGNPVNFLFHLLALAGLKSLYFTGPGAWALER